MNTIRIILGSYFQSPMSNMNFPAYFNYVNTAGKISARSSMDMDSIIFTAIEEQEKVNTQNEENFKQIFEILTKLVKTPSAGGEPPLEPITTRIGAEPNDVLTEEGKKELQKQQRIANLAKAREAKKAKTNPVS